MRSEEGIGGRREEKVRDRVTGRSERCFRVSEICKLRRIGKRSGTGDGFLRGSKVVEEMQKKA